MTGYFTNIEDYQLTVFGDTIKSISTGLGTYTMLNIIYDMYSDSILYIDTAGEGGDYDDNYMMKVDENGDMIIAAQVFASRC
ncbi:MAG: hypothetical protein R2771_00795 [Saprospiraceae bacterium]